MSSRPRSIIVDIWSRAFRALSWLSIFALVRSLLPQTRTSYLFVDVWVVLHSILVLAVLAVGSTHRGAWLHWFLLYGGLRIFEIIVYQANVLLFDRYRAIDLGRSYVVHSHRRLAILTAHNLLELAGWFSVYLLCRSESGEAGAVGALQAVHGSITMLLGHDPSPLLTKVATDLTVLLLGRITGLFMTVILVLRLWMVLGPRTETIDERERT